MLFGFVAATGVLASEPSASGAPALRWALWALAGLAWIGLVWRELRALRGVGARELIPSARGSWLLPAVATQSLAVVAAQHAGSSGLPFAAGLALCCAGLAAYLVAAALIAARVTARRAGVLDVTPDWWIVMGALAISTLAAVSLWDAPGDALDGPLHVASVALWLTASAAIVVVVSADAIRMLRLGIRYEPERWSMVFPLGMYAVATHALGARLDRLALMYVSAIFFGCALAAWGATAAATVMRPSGLGVSDLP
jgi:tellurite resistance protein TehA-like permease